MNKLVVLNFIILTIYQKINFKKYDYRVEKFNLFRIYSQI